ncbi:MAG TPA: ATP synthase F0 subunit B [Blastocatellia bacterium]|nr:ATP synthase F0 subunit B [Blastocatellia bacterium]
MVAFASPEGGGNIIQPNASLIVVLILFLLFVFVLNRILFRPIGRVLDEREALTEGATAEARSAARQYQSRLADYEAAIRQARAENYKMLEQQRAAALAQRGQLIEAAKQQAAGEIEQARNEITKQAVQVRATLEAESRQVAERISRTVLGRAVGGGD